ncbi:hypothetical protein GGS21DRAFT_507250 [Xylaria nigripes]|nr:hypothetical protein GGS21DRAFT_507250 [Xylaria nigripes]
MSSFSLHQSSNDGGSGSGKRNRRSTSDLPLAIKEGGKWSFAKGSRPWRGLAHRNEGKLSPVNKLSDADADINAFSGNLPPLVDPAIANDIQQLRKYTLKIRNAVKSVNHVDSAWEEYIKHKQKCFEWSRGLVSIRSQRTGPSTAGPATRRLSPKPEYLRAPSVETLNLVPSGTNASTNSPNTRVSWPLQTEAPDERCQEAVRGWEATVKHFENMLRTSLRDTYNEYSKDATPEGFERICTDKSARHTTIQHMRNASISKTMSANLDFFPRYDVRFRNYDEIKRDLAKVQALLGRSIIPHERTIIERRISPTGDAILEFANLENKKHPVFRFRVASHCLSETSSPIFGHIFNARFRAEMDEHTRQALPLPPTRHLCSDGNEVLLYRMPQTELNNERSFEILLHAAHNHSDRVPREVQFSQFVAIAEACLRYRCTSPLELAVEHLWLPYWRPKATDDMLEGALLISYIFGLGENFTRLSRIAILNTTGAQRKPCWAHRLQVQEKIAAIRREKMEQISEKCKAVLNEYLSAPARTGPTRQGLRCPRGDYSCDVQNLGSLMRQLAEIGMFSGAGPGFLNIEAPPDKSLAQLADGLCAIASPPQCHGGVCDFAPTFRAAVRELYESVSGLKFFDITGKFGWVLSKNRSPRHSDTGSQGGGAELLFEIAQRERWGPCADFDFDRYRLSSTTLHDDGGEGEDERDGMCYFKILELLATPRDLRSAALVNKRFYRAYLRNEARLWEGMRRRGFRAGAGSSGVDGAALSREKFRFGQVFLVEDKRLLEADGNKYAGDDDERRAVLDESDRSG